MRKKRNQYIYANICLLLNDPVDEGSGRRVWSPLRAQVEATRDRDGVFVLARSNVVFRVTDYDESYLYLRNGGAKFPETICLKREDADRLGLIYLPVEEG